MLAIVAAPAALAAPTASDRITNITVEGTAFRVSLASGRVLAGRDLIGATLSLTLAGESDPRAIRIADIVADPRDPGGEVLLYRLLEVDPADGSLNELCGADAAGERWGFPVPGQWDTEGQRVTGDGFTITCADGAQGKCVRFGYRPWGVHASGAALLPYHQACVRMVRADYCGGHGTTRTGMLIDVYDPLGISLKEDPGDGHALAFEAGWNEAGALCVAHTRVPANMSLRELAHGCPRLRTALGADVCTEQAVAAGQFGKALIYNRSRVGSGGAGR